MGRLESPSEVQKMIDADGVNTLVKEDRELQKKLVGISLVWAVSGKELMLDTNKGYECSLLKCCCVVLRFNKY